MRCDADMDEGEEGDKKASEGQDEREEKAKGGRG